MSWEDAQKELAKARLTVKEKWAAHPTDDFVGEEKKLVTGIETAFAKLEVAFTELEVLLQKQDPKAKPWKTLRRRAFTPKSTWW